MGVGCCACADRKKTYNDGDSTGLNPKDTLKNLLTVVHEKSEKQELPLNESNQNLPQLVQSSKDPGLMEALGIANEYWHNPRIKQVDEKASKVFRYQVAGLVRGERHIYTTDVILKEKRK